MNETLGKLTFQPASNTLDLIAAPVKNSLESNDLSPETWSTPIDASLADTAAFCEHYSIGLKVSANCVIVEAKRADSVWYAACVILATTKADVNGVIRKTLNARKISFAPMKTAVSQTGMEYGGITPIGLPSDWPILVDAAVMDQEKVIIGSGIRGSKLLVATKLFTRLPNATIMPITKL